MPTSLRLHYNVAVLRLDTPARIGLIGGGQLGRMLVLAGKPLGFEFAVLDASPDAPAASIADKFINGSLYDETALKELVSWSHVTTFEIEHANTSALTELANRGALIVPGPRLLSLINDKLEQKRALAAAGVPVPRFWSAHPGTYPVVQKLRHGGYDGRGVAVLERPEDTTLTGPSMWEEKVGFSSEVSVIVARRESGETCTYPPIDLEFNQEANLQARASVPSVLAPDLQDRAREIATMAVQAIGGTGVLAVELFVTADDILVNEIAPRPHNSGHITIEACETSQFEQHLRAICDLPLGPVNLRGPAVSLNLLGTPESASPESPAGPAGRPAGPPGLRNVAELLARPGVHVHWYGKAEVRPYRKMGHVTIVAPTLQEALERADAIAELCWIERSSV